MGNYPNVINAHILSQPMQHSLELQRDSNGYWRVARPISAPSLRERVAIAWRVFTGRYDALDWTLPLHAVAAAEREVANDAG